jgi:hypothetical protein
MIEDMLTRQLKISPTCKVCGKPPDGIGYTSNDNEWAHTDCAKSITTKELRACANPGCGHVRKVKVTRYPFPDNDESFAKFCDACELEKSARIHEAMAAKLRAKAKAIRAKR